MVKRLAEEAIRTRRFPGIAFRGEDWNRRPWVLSTALDVWEIVAASMSFESPRQMAAKSGLSEAQIRLALSYYSQHPEEINDAIEENERPLAELQREFPTIDTIRVS